MPSLSLVFPSDITLSAESSWKLQIDDIYQIDSGTRFGGELHTTPYSCQMYCLVLVADVKDRRRVEIFALHSRRFSPSNLVLGFLLQRGFGCRVLLGGFFLAEDGATFYAYLLLMPLTGEI
jgi:hypothetical protein